MKKVFLDTNILLDYGQAREEYIYAKAIMELGEQGMIKLHASYLSYANMGYILRHYDKETVWSLIQEMREGIEVVANDALQLDNTLGHSPVKDYEDLLQYHSALASGCDVIVTNNKRDFAEFSTLPIYTSKEFLIHYFRSIV